MAVLDRVPVDRITVEARDVHIGRALLQLILGVFWVLGWVIGKASIAVGVAWTAVRIGWQDARKPTGVDRGSS